MRAMVVGHERRVCRLGPGEVKRLPGEGVAIGFYVACPACGFRNFVLVQGQHVFQSEGGITLTPGFWCDGPTCELHLHIKHGQFVVTQ